MVDVLCIVQARLTSSRLPNKVLSELGNSGISMLEHINTRLASAQGIDKIVYAIPDTYQNDKLAIFLQNKKFSFFRGSEDDVLERYYQCALQYSPRFVVRATCDNPCVDWLLVDSLINYIGDYDYVSCKDAPLGTSVEVFTMESLQKAYRNAKSLSEREHVTPYIKTKLKSKQYPYSGKYYRLTIDEEADLCLINQIYSELYKNKPISNSDIYHFLETYPELMKINKSVIQKRI